MKSSLICEAHLRCMHFKKGKQFVYILTLLIEDLLKALDLHEHEVTLKILKILKNLTPSLLLLEIDLYLAIKSICKQLWRIDGKNDVVRFFFFKTDFFRLNQLT